MLCGSDSGAICYRSAGLEKTSKYLHILRTEEIVNARKIPIKSEIFTHKNIHLS